MPFQGKVVELAHLKMLKRPVWQEHGMREGTALFHGPTHDPKGTIVTLSKKLAINHR